MENKRQFKGIWIPKELWINDSLSLQEKCFLAEINSLNDEEKGCYALNEHFAKFFKLSKNRCSEIITSLENKKYIDVDYKYEGKQIIARSIKIKNRIDTPSIFRQPPSESRQTPSENLVDRITLENNILDNRQSKFSPPTLKEIEEYCRQRNNSVDAKQFFDYYSEGDWKDRNGKPIRNWKQKMIASWEKNALNQPVIKQKKSSFFF